MAGWHHRLDGREFEQTPGVCDGQGDLACCDSWGRKESDMTERLHWTELTEKLYNIRLKTSRGALFLPLSDVYVRSFLCLLYTLIKTLLHKSSAIKPCLWPWIEFFSSGDQESWRFLWFSSNLSPTRGPLWSRWAWHGSMWTSGSLTLISQPQGLSHPVSLAAQAKGKCQGPCHH